MKHAIGLLIASVVLTSAHAQEVKRDIPYTKNADKLQTLDVYSPSKAKNLPVEAEMVRLEGPIKEVALYAVKLHLGYDTETEVKVLVVRPAEKK